MGLEKRNTAYINMHKVHKFNAESSFVEVTEWTNGKGYSITVFEPSLGNREITLSCDELDIINYLVTSLNYNIEFKEKENER